MKEAPQVDAATFLNALSATWPFCRATLVCACHLSFGSSHTPKTLTSDIGAFSAPPT
jgi:hypothetical protein